MSLHIQEFKKHLEIRGLADKTMTGYQQGLANFLNDHKGLMPADLTIKHVINYLHKLHLKGQGPDHINHQTAAIKFYCRNVLDKDWDFEKIPYKKRNQKLPVVLEPEEIDYLLSCVENIKHEAILSTIYATGMRPYELSLLKIDEICIDSMTIYIKNCKGGRDRYVTLSSNLRDLLERYLLTVQHCRSEYLFFGVDPAKSMDPETFGAIFRRIKAKAGITGKSNCYSLRHSFATHSLEQGIDIRTIQEALGHRSVLTTCRYLKISKKRIGTITSPYDLLPHFMSKRRAYG